MRPSDQPLITSAQIRTRVEQLAKQLDEDYVDHDPILIPVLKGALHFASDLSRALRVPVEIDFVRVRSYAGTQSSGSVEFLVTPTISLRDRHVIIVEDILDTGRTAAEILRRFQDDHPASLKFCTLLDKPSGRLVELKADYVGFEIDDHFVVGYGLDYEEAYRDLPDVRILIED